MVQRGLSSFRPTEVILTQEGKVWKDLAKCCLLSDNSSAD